VEDFAARLRRIREAKGITPYRLAKLTGLSRVGVLKLERPGVDPKLSTVVKLAEALDVSLDDLAGIGPPPRKRPKRTRQPKE
jgi:transcriptional regulator with XRE-family HTH domain